MDMITVTAKTMDEAATEALVGLEATSDKPEYEVIDKGNTGFPGAGVGPTTIHAKKKESIEDKAMDFLSQIFGAMNMQVDVTATYNQEEQELPLNLEGEDVGILTSKRGRTLDSLQHLMNPIVNKGTKEYFRVKLDTENYRERRKETPETLTRNIAYRVKRTRRPVPFEPMNPCEGRIIHAALQNDKYVTTRSEGEKPFRHVVIVLKKETASGDRKGRYDKNKGGRFEYSDRSGGRRNNRRTDESSAPQTGSDTSAETAAGEEKQAHPRLIGYRQ